LVWQASMHNLWHTLYTSGSGEGAGHIQPFCRGLLEKSEWPLDVDGRHCLQYAVTSQQGLRRPTSSRCDAQLTKRVSLLQSCLFYTLVYFRHDRDISVGTATRYRQDGPGIESRCGARFSAPVQTGPEAHPASYKMGTGSFPGVKAATAWR